jgi:hypothetical protein
MTLQAVQETDVQPRPRFSPALKLAAGLTAAACTWLAWTDDEASPAKVQRDENRAANQTARPNAVARPSAQGIAASTAPKSTAPKSSANESSANESNSNDWPNALTLAARSAWPALTASGRAAWATTATQDTAKKLPLINPKARPIEPEPARVPAFPYTLIGRLDDGEAQALLSGPSRSFGVKAGEVIDAVWRVDAVQPQGLLLTWLPGSLKKTVAFTAS